MSETEPKKVISEALEGRRHLLPLKRAGRLVRMANHYDLSRKDVLKGAAIVGSAALAVTAAYEAYQYGKRMRVTDKPAHHMPDAVSVMEDDGSGGSLPRSPEAVESIDRRIQDTGTDVDIMLVSQQGRVKYPLRDGIEQTGYPSFVERVRNRVSDNYAQLAARIRPSGPGPEQQ